MFAAQFEKIATGWKQGLDLLQQAVARVPATKREVAQSDVRVAAAAYTHFSSVANQARFVIARDALLSESASPAEKNGNRREIRALAAAEIDLARLQFEMSWTDSRIGFEASNHYFYTPLDCVEKVLSCEYALDALEARAAQEPE